MTDPQQLPQFLKDVLTSILKEQGNDEDSRLEVQSGMQENGSYFYRVVVHPDTADSTKCLSMIFKHLSANSTRGKTFTSPRYFKREIDFYTKILPTLMSFQSSHIASVSTPFTSVPKCYKILQDEGNYVIVLEDLNFKGYFKLDRLKGMNIDELRVMFKELGRFHALSLAMQEQDPEGFNTAKRTITEDNHNPSTFERFYKAACDDALKVAKENYPPDSLYVTETQRFVDECLERRVLLTTADPDEPHNVINHGDLWINNFLFHNNEMCFVDFQHCHFGSLALDLSCALLLSMDRATRDKHRDTLLHDYHTALSTLMQELGSDSEVTIPFSFLDGLVTRYAQFAVGTAFLILPVMFKENHHLLEDPEAVISVLEGKTDTFKKRVLEVIEEAVDRGYFDQLVLACDGESETTRL